MSIQEELHNIRNQKTLNDYNQLFHKLNDMVKEELGTDIFTFIKDRERLSNTVHHRTLTEWSYREPSKSVDDRTTEYFIERESTERDVVEHFSKGRKPGDRYS
jgi:hypothetical protein